MSLLMLSGGHLARLSLHSRCPPGCSLTQSVSARRRLRLLLLLLCKGNHLCIGNEPKLAKQNVQSKRRGSPLPETVHGVCVFVCLSECVCVCVFPVADHALQ